MLLKSQFRRYAPVSSFFLIFSPFPPIFRQNALVFLALSVSVTFHSGCVTPLKRYQRLSSDYEKYCEAVLETVGYETAPKKFMAQCISQSFSDQDSVRWVNKASAVLLGAMAVGLAVALIAIPINMLKSSPGPTPKPGKSGKK